MRTKVSKKKRLITVVIASILLLVSIIFIAWKMSSLTRDFLNNDNIRANVDCVRVTSFDDKDIKETIEAQAPDIELTQELFEIVSSKKEELCIVNLEYLFFNGTEKEISDFSMKIAPVENGGSEIYAYSPLKHKSKEENNFVFTQSIVINKKSLDEKYFTSPLPLGFEANLRYTFSYTMSGQAGVKSLKFTTVKREEEIDEYELLFEEENKSDANASNQ